MITHDLSLILQIVYGNTIIPFPENPKETSNGLIADEFSESPEYTRAERSQFDKPLYGKNSLGRPVFLPVVLDNIDLPNPLVTITGKKTIVETPMVGGNGTVKEIINIQDYSIRIICTDIRPDNTWPEDGLWKMKSIWEKNLSLTMQCALTDIFMQAKDNVVITGFSLPDMRGIENAQVYELDLISDTYFELEKTS